MDGAVEFLFDYASPWAYLASEKLAHSLPGVSILFRPLYLRGLESFAQGMPYSFRKTQYILKDYLRCSGYEGVATKLPSKFPINGLYALRGAIWALEAGVFPEYHQAMFRAAWRDDRDISSKETVIAIAGEQGIDTQRFASGIEQTDIKDRLKADTAKAQERGVFGVPSFLVGDELFWGHDRMDYVARAAKGGMQE